MKSKNPKYLLLFVIVFLVLLGFFTTNLFKEMGVKRFFSNSAKPGKIELPADNCPKIEVLAIPGTWESSEWDDPFRPTAKPKSLLLKVTQPLQAKYATNLVEVYTLPYLAQLHNPVALKNDKQVSFNKSKAQGISRTTQQIKDKYKTCPNIKFIILGFSQGAVIAGDIANAIGVQHKIVPLKQVLGVILLADARREPGVTLDVGISPEHVGVEVKFHSFPLQIPGITLTGARMGGVGDLKNKTYSICAPGDLVCDCSVSVTDIIGNIVAVQQVLTGNPIHSQYNTPNFWQLNGKSAVQWILDWITDQINSNLK